MSGDGLDGTVQAVAVQPDGKVLVGDSFGGYNHSDAPYNVLRLNADGTLDTSFNPSGAGASGVLAVQADGKVLVGGSFTSYNNSAAPDYVLRLNAGGSLDLSFNPGGSGPNSQVRALAVQPDGQVLVGGGFASYNGSATAPNYLLRLNAHGTLNDAATPVAGATFVFAPGGTSGNTRTVGAPGTYSATGHRPGRGLHLCF